MFQTDTLCPPLSLFLNCLHSISKCYSNAVLISDWMCEKGGQYWDTACASLCVFSANIFSFMIFRTISYGHYSNCLHAKEANSCQISYLRHCLKCVLISHENKKIKAFNSAGDNGAAKSRWEIVSASCCRAWIDNSSNSSSNTFFSLTRVWSSPLSTMELW